MLESFLSGAVAGYGIAIPVGAIAILIIELGLRRGFRLAAAAGAGAATADGIYASLAAVAGAALADAIRPVETPLRIVAAGVLLGIALRGLLVTLFWARAGASPAESVTHRPGRMYVQFLAITLLNPMTIIYFGALILGLRATGIGPTATASFVAGAFAASLSMQTMYAALGSLGHRRLSPRARAGISALGYLVVLGFAARIASGLP